jgi:methionyl-tRNA formyltransferase
MLNLTVLAAGYRGTAFVSGLVAAGLRPQRVISYRQVGDQSRAFEELVELTRAKQITFAETRYPDLENDELIFIVGWQFLLRKGLERCVVFHDSLLPLYRGFAPTVTALLCGDEEIGITAFRPDGGTDTGPIYGKRVARVPFGASLQAVLNLQTSATIELALELAGQASLGELRTVPQEGSATSSLWRDAFDYFIDWRRDAQQILRQIDYVWFPYGGAKAVLADRILTIVRARLGPDITFAIRDPGKLWQVENSCALVVCGRGTIWIEQAVNLDKQPFQFTRLRTRFLTADTAWMLPYVAQIDK